MSAAAIETGFKVNRGVYVNCDLVSVFPCYEDTTSAGISSTNRTHTYNFTLTNNIGNATDYIVIATIQYNSDGSGGTYNPFEGSSNAGRPMVVSRTSTGFTVRLYKYYTGDNWSGSIMVMVVYPGA